MLTANCPLPTKIMSEALEKVAGIKHLPVFPLPLVLLPNELLPLHIFEPRYRRMIKDVEQDRHFFGVSFFDPETSATDKPAIGTIGCVAEVRDVQTLPDGRSNILTIGVVRYRLLDYVEAGEDYLIGDLDFFEDQPHDSATLQPLTDEVYELFERVAKAAFKISGSRGTFPEIPRAEPEKLSFLITAAFNLDIEMKSAMLEITSTEERLEKIHDMLTQAVDKMEETAEIQDVAKSNGHSDKKIDL
jgi:Lon protease-like protein